MKQDSKILQQSPINVQIYYDFLLLNSGEYCIFVLPRCIQWLERKRAISKKQREEETRLILDIFFKVQKNSNVKLLYSEIRPLKNRR